MTNDDHGAHKRFYDDATADARDGGFAVLIDGRHLRTPEKAPFLAPTLALAEACAQEWREQVATVRPETMPLTKIVNVIWKTRYTDLCYGYIAFWRRHLDVLTPDCNGFEIETLLCIRAAARGLKIAEVASYESNRISGTSNLNATRDGIRILTRDVAATSVREGRALSRYCDYVPQLAKIDRVASARRRSGALGR